MSEPSEHRNVVWRCFCTAWACGGVVMVPVPGGLTVTAGVPEADYVAAMAVLTEYGWIRDCVGLLCPNHTGVALRR